jgi:hypothetical protein
MNWPQFLIGLLYFTIIFESVKKLLFLGILFYVKIVGNELYYVL